MKHIFVGLMAISLTACEAREAQIEAEDAGTGTFVVLNKDDFTAMIVDISSHEVLATLPTGAGEPHEVDISPDGRFAVLTNYGEHQGEPGNTLTVIDMVDKDIADQIDLGEYKTPHGILWKDDEHVLVTAEGSRALIIVHIPSGEVVQSIDTEQDRSHIVDLSSDNRRAFVANIDSGSLTVIDLEAGEVITHVETGEGAEGLAISPDESEIWVTNREENTISVVDLSTYEVLETIPAGDAPIRAKFTPDGNHVLVVNLLGSDVSVFDAASRTELERIELEPDREDTIRPVGMLNIPDNKMLVAGSLTGLLYVIDLQNFEIVDHIVAGARPDGMSFTGQRY